MDQYFNEEKENNFNILCYEIVLQFGNLVVIKWL